MKSFVGKIELIKILVGASALVFVAALLSTVMMIAIKYIPLGW